MDTRKNIQVATRHAKTLVASQPLYTVVILVSLLYVLQHNHAPFRSAAVDSNRNALGSALTAEQLALAESLSTAAPGSTDTQATDRVTIQNSGSDNAELPLATSMSGARVPLTNFTSAYSMITDKPVLTNKVNAEYKFHQLTEQRLFTAIVSSPFAVGFGDDARLAIWHENARFALANKAHKTHKFVVMLDPGHGGTDPGSVGHNGLKEKMLTLDIAKRAQRLLAKHKDIAVVLTRNSDYGLSRKNRVHKVKRSKADMFISLHLNHLPQADVNLVETFYAAPHNIIESIERQRVENSINGMVETTNTLNPNLAFTTGSKQLASIMQRRVFDEVIDNNPETNNAGVKKDTLYILTRSFTPGALIEMSCLSNAKEAERLSKPAYRQKLAAALAEGILDYLATPAGKRQFGMEV